MLSQKVLELVMCESETMIIEWANVGRTPRPEPGFHVIDGYIDEYLTREGYSGADKSKRKNFYPTRYGNNGMVISRRSYF